MVIVSETEQDGAGQQAQRSNGIRVVDRGRRWVGVVIGSTLLAGCLNHVSFLLSIDNGVVAKDYWRFLGAVDRCLDGKVSFLEFIGTTNGPWKSLLTPSLILADAVLFDLALITLHLGSVLAISATAAVLTRRLLADSRGPMAQRCLVVATAALMLVSPMLFNLLAYGQASISIYRVAVFLLTLLALTAWLSRERQPRVVDTASVTLLVVVAIVFVGGLFLPAFLGAIGAALVLGSIGRWRTGRRSLLSALAVLIGVCIAFAVYRHFLVNTHGVGGPMLRALGTLKDMPETCFVFYLRLYATSILANNVQAVPTWLQMTVGATALTANLGGLVVAVRRALQGRHCLPLCLLLYPLLGMSLITVGRVPMDGQHSFATRYLADTNLWQLGLLWLVATVPITSACRRVALRRTCSVLIAILLLALGVVHLSILRAQWTSAPSQRRYAENRKKAILMVPQVESEEDLAKIPDLPTRSRLRIHVRSGVEILQRRRWNVFRDTEIIQGAEQPPPRAESEDRCE